MKPSLKFSPAGHKYWLDGRPIPGVTTLISKGLPKPAIPYWAARTVAEYVIGNPDAVEQLRLMGDGPAIAALKQVPWETRDKAAVRGTDVHGHAVGVIHGETVTVPDHLTAHVQGYADLLERFGIEPILTERAVASRKWFYAGTFDAIVSIARGKWAGRVALVDLKTSSGVYGETALQTAAYASAEWYKGDDGAETPLPEIDCTGVIHVTDAGSEFYPLAHTRDDIAEQFRVFTHVQYIAKSADVIKGYIGEPLHIKDEAVA